MNLHVNDACPFCWHNCRSPQDNAGISSGSLVEMVEFEGGVLDCNKTCNKCGMNYIFNLICKHCKPEQPCHKHYAPLWNGTQCAHMSLEMHLVYMRNSPYCRYWQYRPESIGEWYGKQATNYVDVLNTLKRMTNDDIVRYKIESLRQQLDKAYERKLLLWRGLYTICTENFGGADKCSRAVNKFYHIIVNKFDLNQIKK
jgi:hypothetical protein